MKTYYGHDASIFFLCVGMEWAAMVHCWSQFLLCWSLCLIVDSFVPVQWMPNCFSFHYKSVDCLIVIISTCYFQQQQSVCHLPNEMFVQFLTVPSYLLAGSWMQNWGKGSSFKMPSRVLFWILTVFRVLFRLTPLTFKAELHQDETQLKPFCSIHPIAARFSCFPNMQQPTQQTFFAALTMPAWEPYRKVPCSYSWFGCSEWLWFTVDLMVIRCFAIFCRFLLQAFKIFHSCRLSSRGTLLHWWWNFGRRVLQLHHTHSSLTTSVSCLLKFIVTIVVCSARSDRVWCFFSFEDYLMLDFTYYIDFEIFFKCAVQAQCYA